MLFLLRLVPLHAACSASLPLRVLSSRTTSVLIKGLLFDSSPRLQQKAVTVTAGLLQEARLSSACKSLVDLVGPCTGLGLSLLEAGACSCHTS